MRNRRLLFAALTIVAAAVSASSLRADEEGKMRKSWVVQNVCTYCGPLDGGATCACEDQQPGG
jgi:hypothetical protein